MDGRTLEKCYDQVLQEAQFLRSQNQHLQLELRALGPQSYRDGRRIGQLEDRVEKLSAENKVLKQRLAELTAELKQKPKSKPAVPAFVKANVPEKKRRKKPGRKTGHAAALRPMPTTINVDQEVPVPVDEQGKPSCPHCKTQLSDVEYRKRVVEDIVPANVVVTCFHTTSGWCPCCRKHIESRAEDQPPAADLPHAQLGINALATAAVMRVCYRLPLRQITRLFQQLPGLKLSPGAISKQLKRLSQWLEGQYGRLKLVLRAAGVVHADETGWRTNGRNGYLWTLTNTNHTLFHIDRSRSAKVIIDLLGQSFGLEGNGKLVSDFYAAYDQLGGIQQKCLTHLLRELRDTITKRPELKNHPFFKRCKALIQAMLRLKRRQKELEPQTYEHQVTLLENRLLKLSQCKWGDADADRLTKRLAKYRNKLTPFLHYAELDGTNNAAERAIRPAVVLRKITGGSRSQSGARAWSILASIMRTAEQQGRDVVDTLKILLRSAWAGTNAYLLTDSS